LTALDAGLWKARVGKLRDIWHGYLFRPGGAYAIALCRIFLFSYLAIHIIGDTFVYYMAAGGDEYLASVNVANYYPKSIVWALFPSTPPSGWIIDLVRYIAIASTAMAIIGLATRPAMIISTLSCLFLASLIFSWEPQWSHPYNSGLIAAIPFMMGRAGDVLSADALIAKYVLKRPISINRDVYWWPVILGMFGVSTVYFGGFYAKWSTPDFTYDLSWVFSDNLRNSVALPWLIRGQELPWNVDLIVNSPVMWKLAAFGHIATQALPILAVFSLKRPYIRLAEGLVFVAGVFLLKFVMGMWNPSWIILAAFFVDWEFFLHKAGFALRQDSTPLVGENPNARRAVEVFAALFVAMNLVIIVVRYDEWGQHRFYPFSSMNFYSNVAALQPYGKHQFYPFAYGELFVRYPNDVSRKWSCAPGIYSDYAIAFKSGLSPERKLEIQVGAMKAYMSHLHGANGQPITDCPGTGTVATSDMVAVDLFASILHIPAYPEQVRFEVTRRALVSRYESAGDRIVAAAAGEIEWTEGTIRMAVASHGLSVARYDIFFSRNPWTTDDPGPLIPVPGRWDGRFFYMDQDLYDRLEPSWYPVIVRVTETSGHSYDFFGAIVYK